MDTHNSIVSFAMTEKDKMKQLIYYSEEMSTIFRYFQCSCQLLEIIEPAFCSPTRTFQVKYILEGWVSLCHWLFSSDSGT